MMYLRHIEDFDADDDVDDAGDCDDNDGAPPTMLPIKLGVRAKCLFFPSLDAYFMVRKPIFDY